MFTGHEDQEISFEDGAVLTKRWRTANPTARLAGYFSKDAINKLLEQTDNVGVRIYYAKESGGEMTMVVVGVTSDGNDQIGENDVCLDQAMPCPDYCGEHNLLNSDE